MNWPLERFPRLRREAHFKLPDFITFVEHPLPRNANGKLLKRQLREDRGENPPAVEIRR